MSDLYCPICKRLKWQLYGEHKCPPQWEVREADDSGWMTLYAGDEKEAAEKFCDETDSDREYHMLQTGSGVVFVRKLGEEGDGTKYNIQAESVPEYRAWKAAS